jgi:ER lumen protein retaining receptor
MSTSFHNSSLIAYYSPSLPLSSSPSLPASMIRTTGIALLTFRMVDTKSAAGVSIKTLQLYCLVFICRLASILFFPGYLPYDSTGDWFYQVMEATALICCGVCISIAYSNRMTYQSHLDSFGHMAQIPSEYGNVLIAAPLFLLAVLVHPNLNDFWLTDIAWAYSMYVETFAILPQLFMFQKEKSGEVDLLQSHFVFCLGFARMFEFLFWVTSHNELNDHKAAGFGGANVGYFVVFSQILQLVIMADYFYFYLRAIQRGDAFVTIKGSLPV